MMTQFSLRVEHGRQRYGAHVESIMCFSLCFPWVFRFRNIWKIVLPLLGLSSPNLKVTMRCFFLTVFFTREICWKQFNHGLRGYDTNLFRTESFKFFVEMVTEQILLSSFFSVEFFQSTDSCLKLLPTSSSCFSLDSSKSKIPSFSMFISLKKKVQQLQQILLSLEFAT